MHPLGTPDPVVQPCDLQHGAAGRKSLPISFRVRQEFPGERWRCSSTFHLGKYEHERLKESEAAFQIWHHAFALGLWGLLPLFVGSPISSLCFSSSPDAVCYPEQKVSCLHVTTLLTKYVALKVRETSCCQATEVGMLTLWECPWELSIKSHRLCRLNVSGDVDSCAVLWMDGGGHAGLNSTNKQTQNPKRNHFILC